MILNYSHSGPRRTYAMYPEVLTDQMLFNLSLEELAEVKMKDMEQLNQYITQFLLEKQNSGIKGTPTVIRRVMQDMHEEIQSYKFKSK